MSASIWLSACVTIGPRQTMGWSESTRKPMDMTGRPWPRGGSSVLPSVVVGRLPASPIIRGMAGAVDVGVQEADAGALGRQREG